MANNNEIYSLVSAKNNIKNGLNAIKQNFVIIGYYLKYIRDNKLYEIEDCRDIYEFAEKEFGMSKSSTSRYISINDKFSIGGYSTELLEEYKEFGVSQLTEMINMDEEQISKVTKDSTIKEIRNIKNNTKDVAISQQNVELSALGKPKKVYPEGSLIAIAGCEGYNCFSCGRQCKLRQAERYCVEAPMGNPFYCGTMHIEEYKMGNDCMFVNLDLAYHRLGDKEPVPCCKDCKNQCENKCISAFRSNQEKPHDEAWYVKWFFDKYPDRLKKLIEISKTVKSPSEIAKAFQKYISPYGALHSGCSEWSYSFHAFAGGIDFEVDNNKMHMKYGRFVKEALEMYKESKSDDHSDTMDPNPNIENDENKKIVNESEFIEATTEYDFDKVSSYSLTDVKKSIRKFQLDIASFMDCKLDAPIVKHTRMLMDALQALEESMYMYDMPSQKTEQPEIPILKNNEQRKEWAENFKAWGEWYYDENIDCHYYKYDFLNGDRLIVEEYRDREYYWSAGKRDEVHYHLLQKRKKAYGENKTFEQKYVHQTSSMTEIIEFLKEIQKKGAL